MSTDGRYNKEWFTFRHDGTITDDRFGDMGMSSDAESFGIKDSVLFLQYKFLLVLHSTTRYKIIEKTDSTLVIASRGSKRYPSKIYHLKKMKLHGKFIVA